MLLMQLILLIAGVFCPNEVRPLYFTHILILCLYFLVTRSYKHLIFIAILWLMLLPTWLQQDCKLNLSLTEIYEIPTSSLQVGSSFGFEVNSHVFIKEDESSFELAWLVRNKVALRLLFDNKNKRPELIASKQAVQQRNGVVKVVVKSVLTADKKGHWLQQKLFRQKLDALVTLQVLEWTPQQKYKLENRPLTLKQEVISKLDELFFGLDSWSYSKALLLGDTQSLTQKDRWLIKYLGLMHLFVVSGLHIGFIYLIVRFIGTCSWSILPNRLICFFAHKEVFTLLLLVPIATMYAYLTGWGESVQRAILMLLIWRLVNFFGIKATSFRVLFISLYIILILDVFSLYSPGLWLSFSLVFLLLLYFENHSNQFLQAFRLQVLLTLCATGLILGWQDSISTGAILVNLVVLPVTGLIWFPFAFVASLIALVFGDVRLMAWLDILVLQLMQQIEYVSYILPSLDLRVDVYSMYKLILYLFCLVWVLYRHARYIWLFFPLLFVALLGSSLDGVVFFSKSPSPLFTLANNDGIVSVKKQRDELLLSSLWVNNASEVSLMWLGGYLSLNGVDEKNNPRILIWPLANKNIKAKYLKSLSPRWLVLKSVPDLSLIALLEAMQVSWLVLADGGRIKIEYWRQKWVVNHSNCLIFLISEQESNCMRVAKLESVLNYSPKH